jgi:glycosyltransferase involved in cell wall biosynthesis
MVRGGLVVRRVVFAVPGDLATPTGGYAYDRRMIAELRQLGWQVDVVDLGEGYPWVGAERRKEAETQLLALPEDRIIVVDGLALGVLSDAARRMRADHLLVALVHHPLALESGLSAKQADILRASERASLAAAHHVIVTSGATAKNLAGDYDVAPDKITIACPGSDPVADAPGSSDGIVRLLSVGAIVPRKGFDVLIAALATLADLPWRLTIAGDRTRDPDATAQLDADIARLKLAGRVDVAGAVSPERLAGLYNEADLFALASRYEGYGMAFAEAIAHGLPVVGTTAGAVPDTVPAGTGVLVAPDDVGALALALRSLIGDPAERRRLAASARAAAKRLPSWQESAKKFSAALESFA